MNTKYRYDNEIRIYEHIQYDQRCSFGRAMKTKVDPLGQFLATKMGKLRNWFHPRSSDTEWLPFEERPVLTHRNAYVNHYPKPNTYLIGFSDDSITLVFSDKLIKYIFDDVKMYEAEIRRLDQAGCRRISVERPALVMTVIVLVALGLKFLIS